MVILYGESPCLMGKLTISMVIFNSYFDITRGYNDAVHGDMGDICRQHLAVLRSQGAEALRSSGYHGEAE